MPEQSQSGLQWFWKRVSDYSNIQTLLGIAGGFITSAKAVSMMPGGWHPPQYWASAGAWFFGGWSAVAMAGNTATGKWIRVRLTIHTDPAMPSGPPRKDCEFRFDGGTFDLRDFTPPPH